MGLEICKNFRRLFPKLVIIFPLQQICQVVPASAALSLSQTKKMSAIFDKPCSLGPGVDG